MAHWKNTITIQGFHEEDADFRKFAAYLSGCLVGTVGARDRHEDLTEIATEFGELAVEAEADVEDFDDLLARLYEWGDYDHRLCVIT